LKILRIRVPDTRISFTNYRMKLVVLQSCDGEVYKQMTDATEKHHRKYCEKWGYGYKRWDGVKLPAKVHHPSFAACNRIYLLQEELESGENDWALWLDADSVVVDVNKPLEQFLDDSYCIVACKGGDRPDNWWDINNGVCFFNLRHPMLGILLDLWQESVEEHLRHLEKENLMDKVNWEVSNTRWRISDQQHLHLSIKHIGNKQLCKIYEGEEHNCFNYDGPFIKQLIRGFGGDDDRLMKLRRLVPEN